MIELALSFISNFGGNNGDLKVAPGLVDHLQKQQQNSLSMHRD